MSHDIYTILENLDAAQRSVKQLPALFRPADTSPQLAGPYPGRNATLGYLVGEGEEQENAMRQAVTRRIVNQHPEWIMTYGVEALMQAVDDVTEGDTDFEEIGSSDVSAYVRYVKDVLDDRMGDRSEMADRKPFAEAHDTTITEDPGVPYYVDVSVPGQPMAKTGGRGMTAIVPSGLWKEITPDIEQKADRQGFRKVTLEFAGKTFFGLEGGDKKLGSKIIVSPKDYEFLSAAQKTTRTMPMRPGQPKGMDESAAIAARARGTSETPAKDTATEDVLATMKRRLGDYLQDVATAIKKDPDLKDRMPKDIDQIRSVKTLHTNDGHEIKITGNEDDGFRVSIKNKQSNTKFPNLDEATMAVEMFCARRRQASQPQDYIEEA